MVSQSGISIEVDDERVRRMLARIAGRGEDLNPALIEVGALVRESIRTNFAQGGRPEPWAPVKNRDGQALRDTGRLMNSITRVVANNEVRVGTNVAYAAMHHFGAKRGSLGTIPTTVRPHARIISQVFGRKLAAAKRVTVRGHQRRMGLPWGDIPARPFMLVQDDDLAAIREILTNHFLEAMP